MKIFKALCVLAALMPLSAGAQVSASLVAADNSVQPGKPLTAALRLVHEEHWHTYWINAGTGYPTSLAWELPQGWTAGDIQWPTPIRILDSHGAVTGNGYDGVLYLPVALTPPKDLKPGSSVSLQATAKWLMCADVCIPGSEAVTLTLPVSADSPKPNASVQAGLAKMPMPQAAPASWKIAAGREGQKATLQVAGAVLKSPHFFSSDAFIQYDGVQEASEGSPLTVQMPVSDDAPETDKLSGVLAYTDEQGVYRGVQLDVPMSAGAGMAEGSSGSADRGASVGTSSDPVGTARTSLLMTLVFALIGGLILNLMPCVFPVLGIKVVGFVNQAGNDRRKVTMHGLTFTAGVVLSFWVLAGLLAVLRAGGEELGWGFQLQSPAFVFSLAVIMLIFALSLSGVFEFGVSAIGVGSGLQMKDGYLGSFFTGVLATTVATPCAAPFLAPALGAAFALSTAQSFLVFTFIALGLSAPYLLLSIFPQAVRFLPKPGRWMETFKQAMAFPLYATVGYLLWVLAGQTSENGLLMALLGLTVIAMATWLYGRYCSPGSPGNSIGRARFGLVAGLALFAIGANLGWPRAVSASDLVWESWSAARVQELRDAGRPIYVDFTARWCATCQANKKVVFSSSAVKDYFRANDVAMLKADWTNSDPRITAELAKWNRSAVPFNLVYLPGSSTPKVLPEILTPSIVLDALQNPSAQLTAR